MPARLSPRYILLPAAALLTATAIGAWAATPKDLVHYRQHALGAMGFHFSELGAMVKGKKPFDPKEAQLRAAHVTYLATLPWEGFTPETKGLTPSDAKDALWNHMDDFKEKAQAFEQAADALAEAAKTGDKQQFTAQFLKTAKTCEACHDRYRVE